VRLSLLIIGHSRTGHATHAAHWARWPNDGHWRSLCGRHVSAPFPAVYVIPHPSTPEREKRARVSCKHCRKAIRRMARSDLQTAVQTILMYDEEAQYD
jgi:hypothetical protein